MTNALTCCWHNILNKTEKKEVVGIVASQQKGPTFNFDHGIIGGAFVSEGNMKPTNHAYF